MPTFISSTPTARGQFEIFRPPGNLHELDNEFESDEDTFDFFKIKQRFDFDSTSSGEEERERSVYNFESETTRGIKSYVYIDDYLSLIHI